MELHVDGLVETVTKEAPKKFYPLGALVASAVGGAAATAAAFVIKDLVKKRQVKKLLAESETASK
jgi:hypothetical protein